MNMTKKYNLILLFTFLLSLTSFAQLETPQPSPASTLTQKVALTDVTVNYSRPGMKARTIFGGLVPYNEIWRTGANAGTKLKFSDNVTLAGQEVLAGEYTLLTIPGQTEWTIILNKDLTLSGADGYDMKEDQCRFQVIPEKGPVIETFTIEFGSFSNTGAQMSLSWSDVVISFPIETKAIAKVEGQIKELLIDGPSAGTYYNAARFYLDQNKELDQALAWINIACEKRPKAFWYTHQKAQILAKLGKTKEAIATAEGSMAAAKANKEGDFGYVVNNENLIKELTGKK
jgi:hypothetical protein